jgi:hypothetical protein
MHKESFIINRNTLLHVSTQLGHLQGELFVHLLVVSVFEQNISFIFQEFNFVSLRLKRNTVKHKPCLNL